MPRTNHNQTWDQHGNLIHEEVVEVPDDQLSAEDRRELRIAELEAKLAAIGNATSFATLRQAVQGRAAQE